MVVSCVSQHPEEEASLHRELAWVLSEEVPRTVSQLSAAVLECSSKLPPLQAQAGAPSTPQQQQQLSTDKFLLSSGESVKVVVSLSGDSITAADINLKLARPHSKDAYHNTSVREEVPWVLQQVQDCSNFLHKVSELLSTRGKDTFSRRAEVEHLMGQVVQLLSGARSALVLPKKRSLEELVGSKNVKSLVPALPREVAVSFYIQAYRLVFAVYHMVTDKGVSRFDRYEASCVVPWVNEVLLLLTVALQTAQQLRDKLEVFKQYNLKEQEPVTQ